MQIVFSFDTEDYVDPVSNDALKALAQSHTRHDMPASFGLVGEKARFLQARGRRDVIEAIAEHEIAYHSDHHFMLPDTHYEDTFTPEYMEKAGWDLAVARLSAEESRGVRDVERICGKRPRTWLRTYGDWAPQVLAALDRVGIRVFAYGPPFHIEDPRPIWYCNQLVVANPRMMYEQNLHRDDMSAAEKLAAHKQTLSDHLEKGTARLGVVTHPTRFISDVWWEEPNLWGGIHQPPPRNDWTIPPRFAPDKSKELLWIADRFIEFASEIPDLEPVTFGDFEKQLCQQQSWLDRNQVARLAEGMDSRIRWAEVDGIPVSPAEMLALFALATAEPDMNILPIRPMMGPTEEPLASGEPKPMPHAALTTAARRLENGLRDRACVPACVRTAVGPVGPGACLLALAEALRNPEAETITLPADPGLPEPLHEDDYKRLGARPPCTYIQKRGEFEFPRTTRLGQLQYWTVKPALPEEWV